ncbi:unnamed protein product, partial [Vitis vinifera]
MSLVNNKLSGSIPSCIENVSYLQIMLLDSNSLSSSIPSNLWSLENLRSLDLSFNSLGGSLHANMRALKMMQTMNFISEIKLDPNNILGSNWTEAENFCNWVGVSCSSRRQRVTLLSLGHMGLQGTISPYVGNLSFLVGLDLRNNSFHGLIPESMQHCQKLKVISLTENEFTGVIPNWLSNLPSLRVLYLGWNNLTGTIPPSLGNLQNLMGINFADNNFTGGVIPLYLSNCHSEQLQTLLLDGNQLTGSIPRGIGSLTNLTLLSLSNNNLGGAIPSTIKGMKSLQRLYLGGNQLLSGSIPSCIENLSQLQIMLLDSNSLSSSIPSNLWSLENLWFLNLSFNSLGGSLHANMRSMKMLQTMDLSWNRISGDIPTILGAFESLMAVKVLNLQLEGAFKSFDAECNVLARVRHRNLVKVITSCSNPELRALVLQYMPNGSLEKWLYSFNYSLSLFQRVSILLDVALALEYLHHGQSEPVVHCDLKPSNVLLDDEMVAHVGDFGIAKILAENKTVTQTKTLGTLGYIAPEYGLEGRVSSRGDIYSYGIMLLEMVTRKKPMDEMFSEEMSLRQWVKATIPNKIMEVVDENLARNQDGGGAIATQEKLLAIMELGLECSRELPEERMDIKEVVYQLHGSLRLSNWPSSIAMSIQNNMMSSLVIMGCPPDEKKMV